MFQEQLKKKILGPNYRKFVRPIIKKYKIKKTSNSKIRKFQEDLTDFKLIAFIQIHNEYKKGNLERVLNHITRFCDDIVIYDDGSTDGSYEIALKYTSNIIRSDVNDFENEIDHKQQLLELALSLNPDWIVWLDADEVFDRDGELYAIRNLCKYGESKKIDGFSFQEFNLWRSLSEYRVDENWHKLWQIRLWKNNKKLKFEKQIGLHKIIHPSGMKKICKSDVKVIHFGFSDKDRIDDKYQMYKKHGQTGNALSRIKDEQTLKVKRFEKNWFPRSVLESSHKFEKMIQVNVVTVSSGWILQKIAERIVSSTSNNVSFSLSHSPRNDVDVNFYVDIQNCYFKKSKVKDVGFFTHLDHNSKGHLLENKHWLTCDYIIHMNKKYFEIFSEFYPKEKMSVLKPIEIFPEFNLKKLKLGIIQRGGFEGKGHNFMIRMAEYDYMKNFEFVFCGNNWDKVINLFRSKNIKCTTVNENYENYSKVYDSIDYLLIPSLWEGGPMAVPEALAKGVPIISSDVGWVPEFNVEYLFKPNDELGLLDILKKIRKPLLDRRRKIEDYSMKKYTKDLVKILENQVLNIQS